jgi:hypothetical protein
VALRGFTTATFNGNLGGYVGANTKCRAEFPGSFICTLSDYSLSEPGITPTAAGAWVDYDRYALGTRNNSACGGGGTGGAYTDGTTASASYYVNAVGNLSSGSGVCNALRQIACCQWQ